LAALALDAFAADRGEDACGLFATHDRDARIRPGPEKAGREGAAGHAVIAGAKGATNQQGDLGYRGGRHRRHHLRAMAGDAFVFILPAHHETGDVLQEDERNTALRTQFDEVCAFLGAFGKKHAIIGDNADRATHDVGEAGDQGFAETGLELIKPAAIHHAGNHLADVIGRARIGRYDLQQLVGVKGRIFRRLPLDACRPLPIEICDGAAGKCQRMGIVLRQIIRHA